jgi:pimeloyl-ACP methyl ester carboxylesterase
MQLHFQTYGHGAPVLILHGLFGSLQNWQTISRRLGTHFQVFALDQRNHGASPHSAEMNYRVMVEDLLEFLESQHLNRASLIGHSMGGKTAMMFSLLYPERVDKLIGADIAPRGYPPHHQQILEALMGLNLSSFRSRGEIDAALATAIPEIAVRQFLLKNLAHEPNGGFSWKLNLPAIQANYSRLNEAMPNDHSFDRPALFLRGEASDYIRDSDWPLLQQLFPRAELVTLPAAGHWLHVDAAEKFLAAVQKFLEKS